MKHTFRRIASAVLAFAMLIVTLSIFSLSVSAGGSCGENLTWNYTSGTLTISGTGKMTDYSSGGAPWYTYRSKLSKVIIENGATNIGAYAFYNCTKMTSVTIPVSVTAINDYAFRFCRALKKVTLPDRLTTLGNSAFNTCSALESMVIPESVTSMGTHVFTNCESLKEITLPPYITSIGESAFFSCKSLESITIPAGVTSIGVCAFYYCKALVSIAIPGRVTSLGRQSFYECDNLKNIIYCGREFAWKTMEKGSSWNEGTPAEIQFHNYVDGYCTECGKGENDPDYILGDADGDFEISNSDVLRIYRYIYNAETYPIDVEVADVNKDGEITNADVLRIYRYIYNPELYPLSPADPVTKPEGVLTHAEYLAAEMDTEVTVEAYVQGHQSWRENKINVHAQDPDGGYFFYNLDCSEEDAEKLVPGTKIRVTGTKSEWVGEIEIRDGTFEIIYDGTWIAEPLDVTDLLGTDEMIKHQNELISLKDMTVVKVEYKNGKVGDDIYLTLSKNGVEYNADVEVYLTGPETDVYKAVCELKENDVIDIDGFLYWYNGIRPLITSVTVKS